MRMEFIGNDGTLQWIVLPLDVLSSLLIMLPVFANSGQICSAGTWLFVECLIYDGFIALVVEFGKSLRVGDGRDPETTVRQLVSEEQLKRVTGYLAISTPEGATPLSGGEHLTEGALANDFFVPPTAF